MITPQDLSTKEQSKTLSPEEKRAIAELELYIDKCLKETYSEGRAHVMEFFYNQQQIPAFYRLKPARKKIVQEILFDKYREAGWNIKLEVGEDDGPNRPGIDFWIFTIK
jgi:hypothetical protein